ncbi:type III pantothenate kinase [Heliobacillus mobilis]|uniref:Type III pantothenate kinase n=1 Tax=Heliobacterium mobile TaxID=28064 RepID=A0A6I3SI78_HELMO|nr:type III pantothenate kinase [Heliobacterium mobile]MTV48558.1 type III pantothenate kinase [Heliobacterium mobile]
MLLVLDIGNTNIVAAIYNGDDRTDTWRLTTDRRKTVDEYRILMVEAMEAREISPNSISHVAISSVVPPVNPILVNMFRKYWGIHPLLVQPGIKTGLNIKIDDPRGLGPDRIVNAVGAYHIYGGPVIIVDLGTATTVCAVNGKGDFLGGVICPGIGISVEALVAQAAKLPRVEIAQPHQAIGKNTVEGMQSGIYYGYVGMVDGLVCRFKEELGDTDPPVQVVATGGFGELIGRGCAHVDHIHPALTLEGLRILYERNRPNALKAKQPQVPAIGAGLE